MDLKKLIIGLFALQLSIAGLQAAEIAQPEFSWASLIASSEASLSSAFDTTEESIRGKNFLSLCKEVEKINPHEKMIVNFLFGMLPDKASGKIMPHVHAVYADVVNDRNIESTLARVYDLYFALQIGKATAKGISKSRAQANILRLIVQFIEDASLELLEIQSTSNDINAAIQAVTDLILLFREQALEYFSAINRDQAELLCLNIPIVKALIKSNKVILNNLLLAYTQVFHEAAHFHDSRAQFAQNIASYFPSHLAHTSINETSFKQLSINKQNANDNELDYLYARYNDYAKRKKLIIKLIKNKKLYHPVLSNFLKEYSSNDAIFKSNQKDLKEILDTILDHITLPGCKKLCSIMYGDTLAASLKVARKFGAAEKYEREFAAKVLLRDGHLRTGDIKHQLPSGSHMITEQSDDENIDEEIDLEAISERKKEYSYSDELRTVFFAEILYANPRSVMQTMFDQGIVNMANGVLYSMLSAKTQMDCSFKVSYRNASGKKVAANPQNDIKILTPFIERLFNSLDVTLVGDLSCDKTHIYCVVERVKSKKMGSSYYPQELTQNEDIFFALLEKAFFSQPIAISGGQGFGSNLTFSKKFDIARLIFNVTDENLIERQIEMFVKPYAGCSQIPCIVTAFEHFAAIEVNNKKSFPQALTTRDKSFVFELIPEGYQKLNKCIKCAVYARIMQLSTEKRRLTQCHVNVTDEARYVGIIDINLLQFYKTLTGNRIDLKMPLLIKVPKKQIEIMVENIKNDNLLNINLEQYDAIPPMFTAISSLASKKIANQRIVQTDSFRQILPKALYNALIKEDASLIRKKTLDDGKIQVVFYFNVEKYTASKAQYLMYDRLMATLSPEYYAALSRLKK